MPTKRLAPEVTTADLHAACTALIEGHAHANEAALQRLREFYPPFEYLQDDAIASSPFGASDSELTIAREFGFSSWNSLEQCVVSHRVETLTRPYIERIADAAFREAVEMLDRGDAEGLRAHLAQHPGLIAWRPVFEGGNYFHRPSLLEFVAENPTRNGVLPKNIVEIAKILLAAGPWDARSLDSALELVSSSAVAREAGVQQALIDVFMDSGAKPGNSTLTALLYGEFAAAERLIDRGAPIDLVVAAGTGLTEDARRLASVSEEISRQFALALAAQHGHVEIVQILLDAGADPNRYSPPGGHSHATPLHQAALAGHIDVVRLLIDRGARLDVRDILYSATPLEWAERAGRSNVADPLRAKTGGREDQTGTSGS